MNAIIELGDVTVETKGPNSNVTDTGGVGHQF